MEDLYNEDASDQCYGTDGDGIQVYSSLQSIFKLQNTPIRTFRLQNGKSNLLHLIHYNINTSIWFNLNTEIEMAGCEGIAVIDVFLRDDQIVMLSTRSDIFYDVETLILEDERIVQNGPQI